MAGGFGQIFQRPGLGVDGLHSWVGLVIVVQDIAPVVGGHGRVSRLDGRLANPGLAQGNDKQRDENPADQALDHGDGAEVDKRQAPAP